MRTHSMTWMLPMMSARRMRVVAKTQAIEIPRLRYSSLSITCHKMGTKATLMQYKDKRIENHAVPN